MNICNFVVILISKRFAQVISKQQLYCSCNFGVKMTLFSKHSLAHYGRLTIFDSGFNNDPTKFFLYNIGHNRVTAASIVILKVSSLYNSSHNKCKELLST